MTDQRGAVSGSEVQLLFCCLSLSKMSSDIYATPDLSKKVRYNQKAQKEGAEWEENEVEIYQSADGVQDDYIDFHSQEGGKWEKMRNQ